MTADLLVANRRPGRRIDYAIASQRAEAATGSVKQDQGRR